MNDQEILKENAVVARAFLNEAIIQQEFSWRFQEKIYRAEIKETRKLFNRISLAVSAVLVVIISVLIIVQNQVGIFQNDTIIPILILPLIVVLIVIAVFEFVLIRKIGYKELMKNLGTEEIITKELNQYKKSNTKAYLTIQNHFEIVKKVETASLLPGYLLKILFDLKKVNEETIPYNRFYKYLFYISLGKSELIYQVLEESTNRNEIIDLIVEFSEPFKKLADEFSIGSNVPIYFKDKTVKILDNIDAFDPRFFDDSKPNNEPNFTALDDFLKRISKTEIEWVLVGSTNLALQGIDIQAKDIDIVTTKDGADKIGELFKKNLTKEMEYSEAERFKSYFGKLEIKDIKFEIMAELSYKSEKDNWIQSESLAKKEYFDYKKFKVPVNPISLEKEFYLKINREDDNAKLEKINEFLQS
ncbi:MAG: nucleotidyltransferase domain-containing protein [Candidatus Heimdallarchaeota archaeon]